MVLYSALPSPLHRPKRVRFCPVADLFIPTPINFYGKRRPRGRGGRLGRSLDWRPDGPGVKSRCGNLIRFGICVNSVYPALPVYFGGHTKSRRSFYLVSKSGEVK